ncbi:hypothetical protein [Vibrio diabolicus]|uniref:hypothetical protein n=1 Tax=Vibrio diabolicus TaxID=50719 RepID=UPI00211A0760|nr:hypothetical protein [Vibrio diabolicus]MCQ9052112.1 hypothetical protein [Vibrio diabolicus]MCS0323710.1 hypothetical protein [Vibrio diabolicus]
MKLVDSAGAAALITAYLYCVSTAFTHGYFRTLGLDSDLLERSFQQIVYEGFIQSLNNIVGFSLLSFGCVFVYSVFKISISTTIRKSFCSARNVVRFKKHFRLSTKKPTKIEAKYLSYLKVSGGLFLATFIFIVILSNHEKQGVTRANDVIAVIKNNGNDKVTFRAKEYETSMIFLYCGSRNCAGYDPEGNQIVYVPQTQMTTKNPRIYQRD